MQEIWYILQKNITKGNGDSRRGEASMFFCHTDRNGDEPARSREAERIPYGVAIPYNPVA